MAQSRFYSANAQPTVLTSSVTPSQTVINVQQDVGFPVNTPFIIALDYNTSSEEVCLVTSRAGTNFTVTRAYDGTSGTSHNAGAAVRHTWSAIDGTDSRVHEGSTSGVHGVAGVLVGTTDTQTLTNKSLTSPTITGTVTGSATYSNPVDRDCSHVNSAIGLSPMFVNAVAGTTADLEVIQLNGASRRRLAASGSHFISPINTATVGQNVNAATGFTGNLLELQVNGSTQVAFNQTGDVSGAGVGVMSTAKFKAADTSRASTTTMTADPDLASIPVVSNGVYIVEGSIIYSAIDSADLKCQFTAPAGASMNWHGGCLPTSSTGAVGQYIYDCQTLATTYTPGGGDAAGNATQMILDVKGLLRVSGTAGNFGIQWAQNVSNATATIVRAGSYLQLRRVA